MKRITIFLICVFLTTIFVSCSEIKKSDIEQTVGTSIKNVKVEKLHIDEKFYMYRQDAIIAAEYCDSLSTLAERYTEEANEDSYWAGFYSVWDKKEYEKYMSSAEEKLAKVDNWLKEEEPYLQTLKNLSEQYNSGDVYVVKFIPKTKFNKWSETSVYKVFTYNDDGTLYEYNGDEYLDLVVSAFPEAEKEFENLMKDLFPGLLDSFSENNPFE